jgi:hypothetical protein
LLNGKLSRAGLLSIRFRTAHIKRFFHNRDILSV